jgi:hypothetical protein
MIDHPSILSLIDKLSELRSEMLREESSLGNWIGDACYAYRDSARNLAHYTTRQGQCCQSLDTGCFERVAGFEISMGNFRLTANIASVRLVVY